MKTNIELLLSESLSSAEQKFKNDKIAQQFEKSKNDFKDLISQGLIQERGNNLLSISDNKFKPAIIFNSK